MGDRRFQWRLQGHETSKHSLEISHCTDQHQNTTTRTVSAQLTYDFITGGSASPPPALRQTFRQSQIINPGKICRPARKQIIVEAY